MPAIDDVVHTILCAKRRSFLRSRPVFEQVAPVSEAELFLLAKGMNFKFNLGLSKWLRQAGYGDIDGALRFRENCFSVIDWDPLAGHVTFAQDAAGNCYTFNPQGTGIHTFHPSERSVLLLADDFSTFLHELSRRDYKLEDWHNSARKR